MGKWTRRAFITTGVLAGGVLVVGVAIRPGDRTRKIAGLIEGEGETALDVWVKIAPDNTVTAIIPHAEMGQGIFTTLGMMLADEMDADWEKFKMEEAPDEKQYANYDMIKGFITGGKKFPYWLEGTVNGFFFTVAKAMNLQITGGSGSVRFTGQLGMRVAGAAAKAVLLQAAAEKWDVSVSELTTEKSVIYHKQSDLNAPYADFVERAADLKKPARPVLKKRDQFGLMGTSPPRIDIPGKVDGTAIFGMDVELPNMKVATIKAAPVFGSTLKSYDESAAKSKAGVHSIVALENAVAVVADGYWQANQALKVLNPQFESGEYDNLQQEGIYSKFDNELERGKSKKDKKIGNTETALSSAAKTFEAEYRIPYLAHACMEPLNCTVWIHDDLCEVWTGTQNPLGVKHDVAKVVGMKMDQVKVHNQLLGGGFGRRSETDVPKQAAAIAKTVDFPVKLIWSREETTQQDVYREANISRFIAGVDDNGMPVAWKNKFLYKHHPPEAPYIPYDIENQFIHYSTVPTHVPWGNWRSVDHSMHAFFTESFIDELAHESGTDPYQYRKELLASTPNFVRVLDLAAEKSNWGILLPDRWGRGIAIHQSFGTIVAEVAEVEITEEGKVKTHRVVCAADPGYAMHPDGFKAQMESGVIYGLTAAMYGEITIENGAVKQSNFHDYPMIRMHESPTIETYIVESDSPIGGGGEPATPVIAPALANAIYDATGVRIRELPINNHDFGKELIGD